MENLSRSPTAVDLLAVFDMVAKCAVKEFNVGGAVGARMLVMSLDQKQEGAVARVSPVPESIVSYFFETAQSQAHIGPFVQDMFDGVLGVELNTKGVSVDLVVLVNESQVAADERNTSCCGRFEDVVLVTIYQRTSAVVGKCSIEAGTKICTKGELDLVSLVAHPDMGEARLH